MYAIRTPACQILLVNRKTIVVKRTFEKMKDREQDIPVHDANGRTLCRDQQHRDTGPTKTNWGEQCFGDLCHPFDVASQRRHVTLDRINFALNAVLLRFGPSHLVF